MKVCIEKSHIDNGKARDSQHCMIADAIKDACPSAQFIMVDLQTIRWTDRKKHLRITHLTPAIAQSNLLKFDQGEQVKPFAFTLGQPVKTRAMQSNRRASPNQVASARKAGKTYDAKRRANRKKYAYLAANRARNHQREREFGLRKFVA